MAFPSDDEKKRKLRPHFEGEMDNNFVFLTNANRGRPFRERPLFRVLQNAPYRDSAYDALAAFAENEYFTVRTSASRLLRHSRNAYTSGTS